MKKWFLLLIPLTIFAQSFFEGYISLPAKSPGISRPWCLIYNTNQDRFYLYGDQGEFAVLDGTNFDTIKTNWVNRSSAPPEPPPLHYLSGNNKVYLGAEFDTASRPPYREGYGYIIFDTETNQIIDTILARWFMMLPQKIVYNNINNRFYINETWSEGKGEKQPNRGCILVFNNENNEVLDTIKTFGVPYNLVWNQFNNRLYVNCRTPHYECLNIIDCENNQIIDSNRIRGDTNNYPCHFNLLYNPNLNKVYFEASGALLVVDCVRDSLVAKIELPAGYTTPLLLNPLNNKIYTSRSHPLIIDCLRDSIIKVISHRYMWPYYNQLKEFNSRHNKVYFSTSSNQQTPYEKITIVDGETDSVLNELEIPAKWLCYDENHDLLYAIVGSAPENRIIRIDGETDQIIDTLITGTFLNRGILWNPLNNKIYATNFSDRSPFPGGVTIIDGRTHRVIKSFPTGYDMDARCYFTVNTRENKVYSTSFNRGDGKIWVIDGERDTIVNVINVGSYPCKLEYNSINNKIYCANYENGLAVIDGYSDTIITYIPLPFPVYPEALLWHPRMNKVYCGSFEDNRIAVIDGETNRLLRLIPTPVPYWGSFHYTLNLKDNKLYATLISPPPNFHGSVVVIDANSDTIIKFFGDLGGCYDITWDEEDNKVYFLYCAPESAPHAPDRLGVIYCENDSLISIRRNSPGWNLCWHPKNNKLYTEYYYGIGIYDCQTDSLLEIVTVPADGGEGQPFAINLDNYCVYFAGLEVGRILVMRGDLLGSEENFNPEGEKDLLISPNPSKGMIKINYTLPKGEEGKMAIYDCLGRLVKDFSLEELEKEIFWQGKDNKGREISNGVYILQLKTKRKTYTKKFIWQR
ncbi:MAG: T9SS type A sorting domain-containing protein [candidate division WOR-3 bacterium]